MNKFATMLIAAAREETRQRLMGLFQDEYDYLPAASARELLDKLRLNEPEIIVLHDDIDPEGLCELITCIRKTPGALYTPIAYVSGDDPVLQRRALGAGADAFITFSYDPAVIRLHMRNIVEKYMIQILLPQRQLDYERMINRCLRLIYGQAMCRDTLMQLLRISAEYMHSERAYAFERRGNNVVFMMEHLTEGTPPQRDDLRSVDMSVMRYWEELAGEDSYVCIDDAEDIKDKSPIIYERLNEQGIRRMVLMLTRVDGALKGVIGYDNPTLPIESLRAYSENIFLFLNISLEKTEREHQLSYATYHDALTGVLNRNCFRRDLEQWSGMQAEKAGLLYADLNGLKEINDHQSHSAGDRLLIQCTQRLHALCKTDLIYRMGGDEFIVVMPNIEKEDFNALSYRIKREFGADSACKAAIGVAYWRLGEDFEAKLICADRAMYEDKAAYYSCKNNNRRRSGRITE